MELVIGASILFSLTRFASCSNNYASTNGYWNSRGSYYSSLTKGQPITQTAQSQYDPNRYGPPPLGPQIPQPMAQKSVPTVFQPINGRPDNSYLNQLPTERPSCARKRDYCLADHDYPMEMVKSVVQRYHGDVHRMYSEMQPLPVEVAGGNVSYRYNFPSERGAWACETDIFTMRIGWARNWAGRWKVVLNTDQFPQAVRLEHCKYENRSCQMMPPCVRSSCLQRYTAVQLLSTDPQVQDPSPTVDTFLLPGGCSCYIDFL